jgi:hypothetical protein
LLAVSFQLSAVSFSFYEVPARSHQAENLGQTKRFGITPNLCYGPEAANRRAVLVEVMAGLQSLPLLLQLSFLHQADGRWL